MVTFAAFFPFFPWSSFPLCGFTPLEFSNARWVTLWSELGSQVSWTAFSSHWDGADRACRPLNVVRSGDAWRPGAGDRQLFSTLLFQAPFSKCRSDQDKNSAVIPVALWLKIQISVELVLATGVTSQSGFASAPSVSLPPAQRIVSSSLSS